MNRSCFSLLAVSIWAAGALPVFAAVDPCEYQRAFQLERTGDITQAKAIYERIVEQFPNDPLAGPDNAGFRVKYVAAIAALKNGDVATARTIADEITSLASSPQRKPFQLYWTARIFEDKKLFDDAASLYRQVISRYPASVEAGDDNAGFRVKWIAFYTAVQRGDVTAAKTLASEISALNASPRQKPSQLFSIASGFEDNNLLDEAEELCRRILAEYPASPEAGLDFVGFRVKSIAFKRALQRGDIAAAGTIVEEIKSLGSSPQKKSGQLYWTARTFEDNNLFDDASALYRLVMTAYSASPEAKLAEMRNDGVAVRKSIADGNLAAAISGTAALKAKYADGGLELTRVLFVIGEAYCQAGQGKSQNDFFQQSVNLFKNDILARELTDNFKAAAYYMLGLNYERRGEYAKAADAFEKAFHADPKFMYADYCLFAAANCYAKLASMSTISEEQANVSRTVLYRDLAMFYPSSKYIPYANAWEFWLCANR